MEPVLLREELSDITFFSFITSYLLRSLGAVINPVSGSVRTTLFGGLHFLSSRRCVIAVEFPRYPCKYVSAYVCYAATPLLGGLML